MSPLRPAPTEDPRKLAEAYIFNHENRGVCERFDDLSAAAFRFSGNPTPVDFVLGGDFARYAARELDEIALAWEEHLTIPVRRVLDAGCGPGVTTLALAARYREAEVVGVDVEETALNLARYLAHDEPRCSFRHQALEAFEDEEHFDVIECRAVLEHVYEPSKALAVLLRHLNKGGVLYVETPNYLYPFEPHLQMPIIPKSPKWLIQAQCWLTGRNAAFVDHLNLSCDSVTIRRWAHVAAPDVNVIDLMARKSAAVFDRDDVVPRVASRARTVARLKRFPPAARVVRWALTRLPIAPSVVLLFVRKN